jgi:5-methylthioadenosine/S-adenosylhomocysteine deaminase
VGVGTDSVASVDPLDLLAEARRARELGSLDAQEALALVTIGAARAIGLGDQVGSLEEGKWGDLVALQLPACDTPEQLFEAVLASGPQDLTSTWIGGREVYRKPA